MYLGNREMEEGLVVWAAGRSLDDRGRGHETHRQMTGILDGRGKELIRDVHWFGSISIAFVVLEILPNKRADFKLDG